MNHSNNFCHPAHNDEQQQLQQQQYSNTLQSSSSNKQQQKYMAGIYKYILVRCAAAYSIIIICQVKVLCCETAHGVDVTKKRNNRNNRAAAAAAALLYVCIH